jgi:hypothetical protein
VTSHRYDIIVKDSVAKSIKKELLAIAAASVKANAALLTLNKTTSQLAKTQRDAAAAISKNTAALKKLATADLQASRDVVSASSQRVKAYNAESAAVDALTAKNQARVVAQGAGTGAPPVSAASSSPVTGGGAGVTFNTAEAKKATAAVKDLGKQTRIASHHTNNLLFQVNDVFVSLASGQNPITVFVQQGSQIGQIMLQAGMGVKSFAKETLFATAILRRTTEAQETAALATAQLNLASVAATNAQAVANVRMAETEKAVAEAQLAGAQSSNARSIATARLTAATQSLAAANSEAALTERVLAASQRQASAAAAAATAATTVSLGAVGTTAAIAAAAFVAVGGGVAILTEYIRDNRPIKDMRHELGLTIEEAEELGKQFITTGDTLKAMVNLAGDAIWATVGPAYRATRSFVVEAAELIGGSLRWLLNKFIGVNMAMYKSAEKLWEGFPYLIGNAAYAAVNMAIDAVNFLVQSYVDSINNLKNALNIIIPDKFDIEDIKVGSIDNIPNPYKDKIRSLVDDIKIEAENAMGTDYVGQVFDLIADEALNVALERLRREAEEIKGGRRGKTDAEKRIDELAKINRELDGRLRLSVLYGTALAEEAEFTALNNGLLNKKIHLTKEEEQALRGKISAILEAEAIQEKLLAIEKEAVGVQRDYARELKALDLAVSAGILSKEEAARKENILTDAYLSAIDPLREYRQELEQNARAAGLYGKELAILTMAQQLYADQISRGLADPRTAKVSDYDAQARKQYESEQLNRAFEAIDPQESVDPTSYEYILDNHQKMYEELARLRELDVLSEEEAARRKENLDKAYLDARLQNASTVLGNLSVLQNSKSKEVAAIGKAAAIAQATIDGYRAVQAALAGPPGPPWSYAIAASTGVATAANVAKIAGIGFRTGGYTGSGRADAVAGVTHREEYVLDAPTVRNVGVNTLDRIRATKRLPEAQSSGPSVVIKPQPGVYVEEVATSDGHIELIARRVVKETAGKVVAQEIQGNPNGSVPRAIANGFGIKRSDR